MITDISYCTYKTYVILMPIQIYLLSKFDPDLELKM